MFKLPDSPSPQAESHELADFAELLAWEDGAVSERNILSALGREDENDNNVGCDDNDDRTAEKLDGVMNELSRRAIACGNGYPFVTAREGTVLRYLENDHDERAHVYRYLLLSTRLNMMDKRVHANIDGGLLLEEVAAHAMKCYMGFNRARAFVFGTSAGNKFEEKVDELCTQIGEGTKFKNTGGGPVNANDDKLDVVTWIPFSDGLRGQLVIFSQCKTGSSWGGLVSHLQPETFIKNWMLDGFALPPVRGYCISEAADRSRWYHFASYAGLLLDRCRIVDFSSNLEPKLLAKIQAWNAAAKKSTLLPRGKTRAKRQSKKKGKLKKASSTVKIREFRHRP
jgi:hypothetical protein